MSYFLIVADLCGATAADEPRASQRIFTAKEPATALQALRARREVKIVYRSELVGGEHKDQRANGNLTLRRPFLTQSSMEQG